MISRRRGAGSQRLMRVLEQRSTIARQCDAIEAMIDAKYDDELELFSETSSSLTLISAGRLNAYFAELGIDNFLAKFSISDFNAAIEIDVKAYVQSAYVRKIIEDANHQSYIKRVDKALKDYFRVGLVD
jgi:hypothetical protein